VLGGTGDTLRLIGEQHDLEEEDISVSKFIDDASMAKLLSGAEGAFSKAGHGRLMKPVEVGT
jgi:hypothetical protein